jgi:hypothetical protein
VPSYLVERYLPEPDDGELEAAIAAIAPDVGVRHLRATYVPEDETSFHVIEAPSARAIREVLGGAGITYERVVEAVDVGKRALGANDSS